MTRRARIFHLLFFLLSLFVINFFISRSISFPRGDSSIWFHSGLLMVIVGTYWVEHYFTKPADVVINGLIVIIAVSTLSEPPLRRWWDLLLVFSTALVFLSFGVIWAGTPALPQYDTSRSKKFLYMLVTRFGSSQVIFSAVFVLALISFFSLQSQEAMWLAVFWGIILAAKYVDLAGIVSFLLSFRKNRKPKPIGKVTRILDPGIVHVRLNDGESCRAGDLLAFTSIKGLNPSSPIGVAIGHTKSPDSVEARVLILDAGFQQGRRDERMIARRIDPKDEAIAPRISRNLMLANRSHLVGFASKGTHISRLIFELVRNPRIEEGHLVSVPLSDNRTLYFQVIDGKLFNESALESSERAYAIGEAEQLGVWSPELNGFGTFDWIAPENSPVFHVSQDMEPEIQHSDLLANIGLIPNSAFPAFVNLEDLIPFHTAVLGVTGCGKTFLAYSIIEECVRRGIKALCLDITGDYQRYLGNSVLLRSIDDVDNFLDSDQHMCGIFDFSSERRHPVYSTKDITEKCLNWCRVNREPDEVLVPQAKVLLVLEEAHLLIPEWNFINNPTLQKVVNETARVGLQARKFGLGFMVVTQRTANVTKSILNQCNTIFAFQAFDETGFEFMRNYIGEHYVDVLPNLRQRRCVLVGKASVSDKPLIVELHYQERVPSRDPIPHFELPDEIPF